MPPLLVQSIFPPSMPPHARFKAFYTVLIRSARRGETNSIVRQSQNEMLSFKPECGARFGAARVARAALLTASLKIR